MKKITTLLIALACVAISASATVTINVRTSTGEAPFLYVWGDATNGDWPGTQMVATQTVETPDGLVWFTQSFDTDALNIIFNDGMDPIVQSPDILGVTGTAYFTYDMEEGTFENVTSTYVEDSGFDPSTLPEGVVFVEGKEFAYFIAPVSWTKCNVWAWSATTGTNFTQSGVWPGDPITLIGNTTDGNPVYQWIGPDINENDRPEGIIFSNSSQTKNLTYVAGGVYNLAGELVYTVEPGGEEPVAGDVNGDGECTASDVTALYNYILYNDDSKIVNGDQNNDGQITASDVTAVYNIILGL